MWEVGLVYCGELPQERENLSDDIAQTRTPRGTQNEPQKRATKFYGPEQVFSFEEKGGVVDDDSRF